MPRRARIANTETRIYLPNETANVQRRSGEMCISKTESHDERVSAQRTIRCTISVSSRPIWYKRRIKRSWSIGGLTWGRRNTRAIGSDLLEGPDGKPEPEKPNAQTAIYAAVRSWRCELTTASSKRVSSSASCSAAAAREGGGGGCGGGGVGESDAVQWSKSSTDQPILIRDRETLVLPWSVFTRFDINAVRLENFGKSTFEYGMRMSLWQEETTLIRSFSAFRWALTLTLTGQTGAWRFLAHRDFVKKQ